MSPSPGALSSPDAAGDPGDREGAVPTLSRDGLCPCAPWPQLPREWQNPQSSRAVDRSHISAAAVARQQWKMAKNVALDLTRLEPAGPGLQALSPRGETEARMDLSALTRQLSTGRWEGTPFSMGKQQIIGKSCALTRAASVTAMGEQQDLGPEVFWAWEWSGDSADPGDGEGAQRELCSAAHGAARKCFYWEKPGMVLLLVRGSPVLEFGDELDSSAAVTFGEAKSGWPPLATESGGGGHP